MGVNQLVYKPHVWTLLSKNNVICRIQGTCLVWGKGCMCFVCQMKTVVGRTFSRTEFLFQSAALLRRLGFVKYEWIAPINGSECSEILRALPSKEARLSSVLQGY